MKLDPIRLARQELAFTRWRVGKAVKDQPAKPAIGIIEAITGFGKTYILILAIKFMNTKYPDRTAIIVVPTTKLLDDWMGYWTTDETTKVKTWVQGHIEIHKLENVKVFVVNTFVKYQNWKCDLFGLDECHHYANDDSQFFSTVLSITSYRFLLAMSATLSKKQEEFFLRFNIPIVDNISEQEAQQHGFIAPSIIYNLGIKLSIADEKFNKDINDKFKFYFSRFNHEFDLVKACSGKKNVPISVKLKNGAYLGKKTPKDWIQWLAKNNNYDGNPAHPYAPDLIARNAAQCMRIIHVRKNKWQNFPSKIDVAAEIIRKFPVQTIAFSETAEFADKLATKLPDICMAYHTRLKTIGVKGNDIIEVETRDESADLKQQGFTILGEKKRKTLALKRFMDKSDPIRALSTVKALDEGVDIPSIELVLMIAYTSTARQDTQRKGRGGRIDYDNLDKRTLIINLYMMGTQEEKWLKEKQKGTRAVIWVDSINQINPSQTITLSASGRQDKEVVIDKSEIETRAVGANS